MTRKSILMMGASALIFSGAAFTTALADDYGNTPVRYDSQAEQTRELNNESLEQAQAENGDAAQPDDDDGPAVVPTEGGDPLDDEGDDDAPTANDGTTKN